MSAVELAELAQLLEPRLGWCVSLYLPTEVAGPQTRQNPIRFKNLLRDATEQLRAANLPDADIETALAPAHELLADGDFWQQQRRGLAVFLAEGALRRFHLPTETAELAVVGRWFHLKPLLSMLHDDGRFFVLALSHNSARLLACTRDDVGEITPAAVAAGIAAALAFDDSEAQLQYHTGTAGGRGDRAAIYHGHGVGTDDRKDRALRYCSAVDAALRDVLREERAPLVLACVGYLLPIYRQASGYAHVLEQGIDGNPDERSDAELHEAAWQLVRPHFEAARGAAAERFAVARACGLGSDQVEAVVAAATHGRVETLFTPVGVQIWGSIDAAQDAVRLCETPAAADQDLLDLAAVQTLRHGGTVYAVAPECVPGGAPIAAVFRD